MAALTPISHKQAVITISDISGVYWLSVKGGKVTREKVKYNDGKTGIEQTFVSFLQLEQLTLMKSFDPSADKVVVSWIKKQIENPTPFNVAIQPIKTDLAGSPFEGSSQLLYSNCVLAEYKYPEFDRSSANLAMIEIAVIFNSLPTYQ